MTDEDTLALAVRLEEATKQGRETIQDLNAAVTLAREEMRRVSRHAAQRYLASALETAAESLRSALKGKT